MLNIKSFHTFSFAFSVNSFKW